MELAIHLSGRGTCARAQVGSVIVSSDNTRILAVGYNGNAQGFPNQCDTGVPGGCGCLHAEENACIKLDFSDPCKKILYTKVSPCGMCAKRIVNARISEVVYYDKYRDLTGVSMLQVAGIPVRQFR